MIQSDWSKVQAMKPGTPITLLLHKDRGPRGSRKLRDRFHSATEDSLTLVLKDGQSRTFQRWAVRKVLTLRPIGKRYQVWITLGISALLFGAGDWDMPARGRLSGTGMITGIAFLAAPKMNGICNVPPKYRTKQLVDKPSGDEGKTSEPQRDAQ